MRPADRPMPLGSEPMADASPDAREPFWIAQYHRATGAIELEGERVCVGAGDIVFGNCGMGPVMGEAPPGWTAWTVPRPLFAARGSGNRLLRAHEPLGAIATAYLAHMRAVIAESGPDAAAPLMATLATMLSLHPGGGEDRTGGVVPAEARLAAIRRSIATHYADPGLSPRRMAAEQGISVRTLHLLFERNGKTFRRQLLETRLAAAHTRLVDPVDAGRTVTDIAFSCGFEALSSFYRTFRERYGLSPIELRSGR